MKELILIVAVLVLASAFAFTLILGHIEEPEYQEDNSDYPPPFFEEKPAKLNYVDPRLVVPAGKGTNKFDGEEGVADLTPYLKSDNDG